MATFTLLATVLANPASADPDGLQGLNSVDTSTEPGTVSYDGGSAKFPVQLAAAIVSWNDLGLVQFVPDAAFAVEDLDIDDVLGLCDQKWFGSWEHDLFSADNMRLNVCRISQEGGPNQAQKTAAHELGHALSLDHNSVHTSVMIQGKTEVGSAFTPGDDDILHYHEKWDPDMQ